MKIHQKGEAKMQKHYKICKKIALELSENSTKIGRKSIKIVQKQDGNIPFKFMK